MTKDGSRRRPSPRDPATDTGGQASNYQVRALERALDIFEAFSLETPELSLTRLAERVDLPKSTVVRLVSILTERGYLERIDGTDAYHIGVRAFEIGSIYIQMIQLETEARSIMARLAKETRQTANLGILDRGEVVHIAVVTPDRPVRYWATVGKRDDAHSTGLGKALLASRSDAALADYFATSELAQHTPHTITEYAILRAELDRVRTTGYAMDDEESDIGVRCVAAPIVDRLGTTVAALSISGLKAEFADEVIPLYAKVVMQAAHDISQRLGGGSHAPVTPRD